MASLEWDINVNFGELDSIIDAAMPIALGRAAEHIRAEAVKLTPVEIGDLAASAGVVVHGDTARVEYQSIYARYQHYGLDFKHPIHGQALFLEQPMTTETGKVQDIIADTLREAL